MKIWEETHKYKTTFVYCYTHKTRKEVTIFPIQLNKGSHTYISFLLFLETKYLNFFSFLFFQ